jgi:hypothetical protein
MRRETKLLIYALLAAALILSGACQSAHNVHHGYLMRGSIVDKSAEGVVLCIGSKDGATPGQELAVIKVTQGTPKGAFVKQKVGVVKITAIIDEHFAKATVKAGQAELGQIVELE